MALWVDKYRPKELLGKDGVDYHIEQAEHLKILSADCMPHLLFCGPSGAGKKTRIKCLLRELYGIGVDKTQLIMKPFTTPSNRKLEIQTVSSNYHVEMTPSDVGIYDRVIVQDLVKEMAQTSQIEVSSQRNFKVVVLCEADSLTRDAQHGLRRTMEKYANNCKIILCCESLSRIIEPLQSRCIIINVPAPTNEQMTKVLTEITGKEKFSIPPSILQKIIEKSEGNLRRAILTTEAFKVENEGGISANAQIPTPEWEIYIQETARLILQKQSSDMMLKVRERLYEILSRLIPPTVIFKKLLEYLLPSCPSTIVREVVSEAAKFEHRLVLGQKAIFHLEAFVIAFMDIYLSNASKTK
uniref:Replication factor C subunit 3 n=1 Tax=Caenorhabditis tropicalis TaxID=1561998 RepID=A0A1I7TDP6_9PELO